MQSDLYEIRQFRPLLLVLVALGITGFAIATTSPLLWMFGISAVVANAWLVRTGRFRPLPRWAANVATVAAAGVAVLRGFEDKPIVPIGEFLLLAQLIKLYEQRTNRDYYQVLTLSLLLVVAALVSTASLLFGLVGIAYLLIAPYVALLFHLKTETDFARRQFNLDERSADATTLRQDRRLLGRSMGRLTALVASASLVVAVLTFLFFPRGSAAGVLNWQIRPPVSASGMSESIEMDSVSRVQQNLEQVGTVKITHNGAPVTGGEVYLRGTVYDSFDADPKSPTAWNWSRRRGGEIRNVTIGPDAGDAQVRDALLAAGEEEWTADFQPLLPINVPFLLSVGDPVTIRAGTALRVYVNARDRTLNLPQRLTQPLRYTQRSAATILATDSIRRAAATQPGEPPRAAQARISPEIERYARQPEVTGIDEEGRPLVDALARQLAASPPRPIEIADPGSPLRFVELSRPPELAATVAANIERHLRSRFQYTLDTGDSDAARVAHPDPIARFLYDTRRGWCEHFAGAMTVLCQSVGLQARLVSGYKISEFNSLGGYFIIRQSDAHAWVEVLVRDGARDIWMQFDPTAAGDDSGRAAQSVSLWKQITHFFDYLEHTWETNVVAYDNTTQTSLLENVENRVVNAGIAANENIAEHRSGWREWLTELGQKRFSISETVILALLTLFSATAVAATVAFVVGRLRLRRRARRIGLGGLDTDEALRLARQLGFYDDLIGILRQRQIARPAHMTPLEFGRSLDFLPREAYEIVLRLTQVFYRVRFGAGRLSAGRQQSLGRVVARLRDLLLPDARAN